MKRFYVWVVAHPVWAISLILGLTVLFATYLPRLEIDFAVESLMTEHDPARAYYARVKQQTDDRPRQSGRCVYCARPRSHPASLDRPGPPGGREPRG
jgi:hypothetical protein